MTEKRFTITQDFEEHHRQIRDDGYVVMGCFIEPQAEVIVDLLNQLNDENKQLKQENEELKKENQGIQNKIIRLLDFVEKKQCVTRTEIKKWWNDD